METNNTTSIEIKDCLSKLYEDSVSSICKMIEKIGTSSYSMNGYWMSTIVYLKLDGNCVGPSLIHCSNNEKSFQIQSIEKCRNGSGSSFEIRLRGDKFHSIVLPKKMNVRDFPYRTQSDFLPTISILRSLEYIASALV